MISKKHLTCDSKEFGIISSELLRAGNTIRFRAKGTSMQPLIRDGDIVCVAPPEPEQAHKGDVVLFVVGNGRALLHRVVNIRKNNGDQEFLIQGDHSIHSDGYISKSDILGMLVAVERGGLRIPADRLLYKYLGRLSSLYMRVNPKNTRLYVTLYHLLKQLPFFKKYLS